MTVSRRHRYAHVGKHSFRPLRLPRSASPRVRAAVRSPRPSHGFAWPSCGPARSPYRPPPPPLIRWIHQPRRTVRAPRRDGLIGGVRSSASGASHAFCRLKLGNMPERVPPIRRRTGRRVSGTHLFVRRATGRQACRSRLWPGSRRGRRSPWRAGRRCLSLARWPRPRSGTG